MEIEIKTSGVRENPDGKWDQKKIWVSERMLIAKGGQNENVGCQRKP